ncbi:MAG: hypothetical protein NC350_04240 [Corallococcus sp.]|nr:hypothetical protein [Corallococcus sp.]
MNYYTALLKNLGAIKEYAEHAKKIALHKAIVSHNCYRGYVSAGVLKDAEDVYKCAKRYHVAYELRQSAIASLKKMDKQGLLLLMWHTKGINKQRICKRFGQSERTLFRKSRAALCRFQNLLSKDGYDEDWFRQCAALYASNR